MRLINADIMRADWLENGQNEYVYDTNAILDSIDEQPTIEAEPVRHGYWIERDGIFKDGVIKVDHLECSECGKTQRRYRDTPYCPNCGAKMDLEA